MFCFASLSCWFSWLGQSDFDFQLNIISNKREKKSRPWRANRALSTWLPFAWRLANTGHGWPLGSNSLYNINTASSCIYKVLKNGKRLVAYRNCLGRACFAKIQILEFASSTLPLFYSLFRFKSHHCIEFYIRKVLKNRKRKVISQSSKSSFRRLWLWFRKIQIFEYTSWFCISAVLFLVLGYWLLWYVHCSTCLYSFRFVSQNTIRRLF